MFKRLSATVVLLVLLSGKAGGREIGRVRLLDASGHPVTDSGVRLEAFDETGRFLWTTAGPDGEGTVALREAKTPPARIVVWWHYGYADARRLRVIDLAAGTDLKDTTDLRVEGLRQVRVRVVDAAGTPLPRHRVLWRMSPPRREDDWERTWTDVDGWARIGVFVDGERIELQPGEQGRTSQEISCSAAEWHRTVVGPNPVTLVSHDPRLMIALRNAPLGADVPIRIVDMYDGTLLQPTSTYRAGDTPWIGPALKGSAPVGVMIGPVQDGRYAFLADPQPGAHPIAVTLVQGQAVDGALDLPERLRDRTWSGRVHAVRAGFQATTAIDDKGRFRFPVLPPEPVTLVAEASLVLGLGQMSMDVQYVGRLVTGTSNEVRVPMVKATWLFVRLEWSGEGSPDLKGIRVRAHAASGEPASMFAEFPETGHVIFGTWRGVWTVTAEGRLPDGQVVRGRATAKIETPDEQKLVVHLSARESK